MRSLAARLTVVTMLGTVIVLATSGLIIFRKHEIQLFHNFDASLRTSSISLSGRLLHDEHLVSVNETTEQRHTDHKLAYIEPTVQVFDSEGVIVYETSPEFALDTSDLLDELKHFSVTEATDSSGTRFRAFAVPVAISPMPHTLQGTQRDDELMYGTLVVAARSEHLHAQSHDLAHLILQITVFSTLLAGFFVWFAVRYGLKPLGALATRIGETTLENLDARISSQDQPTEIVPVVERLNDLLGRLDEAIARERTMSTNVAHELRTPVAALISTLEVRLRAGVGKEEEQVLTECLAVAQGMQSVVGSLLVLTRLESGQVKVDPTDTPVIELIEEIWQTTKRDGVELKISTGEEVVINADRELLRIAFANALANAAQYAPDGSSVTVTAAQVDDLKIVTVQNHGCTLAKEDADKVFDRFWRQDEARSDANLHCGLGATLIRQAGEASGAIVSAYVEGDSFMMKFEFPV